jgi:hypothetical protein
MDQKRSPFSRMGPFIVPFLVIGVCGASLLYVLVMGLLGWPNPMVGAARGFNFFGGTQASVYLYESPTSKAHYSRVGGQYDNLLAPWRTYFTERGRSYKSLVSPDQLDSLKSGVVILPSAVSLSDAERTAFQRFRAKGGAVLATWAAGTRNEGGDWIGWQFLQELGVVRVQSLDFDKKRPIEFSLLGNGPLSVSHAPGQVFSYAGVAEVPFVFEMQYSSARLLNGPAQLGESAINTVIGYAENKPNGARSVVFGFAESAWEAKPFTTHQMIDDAINWLRAEANVIPSAWPNGLKSTLVVQINSGDDLLRDPASTIAVVESLKGSAIASSVFIPSQIAKVDPPTIRTLARLTELAYLENNLELPVGAVKEADKARFQKMKGEFSIATSGSIAPLGFRASGTDLDAKAEAELPTIGVRYIVKSSAGLGQGVPSIIKVGPEPSDADLVALPLGSWNDRGLEDPGKTREEIQGAWAKQLNQHIESGTLAWLSLRGAALGTGSPIRLALEDLIVKVNQNKNSIWIANPSKVAQWWRDRQRIKSSSTYDGKKLDFSVTITGESSVNGASFTILLPSQKVEPTIQSVKIGVELPTVTMLDPLRARVVFADLKPGNYNYTIRFDPK